MLGRPAKRGRRPSVNSLEMVDKVLRVNRQMDRSLASMLAFEAFVLVWVIAYRQWLFVVLLAVADVAVLVGTAIRWHGRREYVATTQRLRRER